MKASVFVLLFVFCYAECRKVVPIDKHANIDFINMETGGGVRPGARPAVQPTLAPVPAGPPSPGQAPTPAPKIPVTPPTAKLPPTTTAKPVALPTTTAKPVQLNPRPVNPVPASNPITTPGPGTVKDLVNFYNTQGKGSPIRPYTYSQAVKQG